VPPKLATHFPQLLQLRRSCFMMGGPEERKLKSDEGATAHLLSLTSSSSPGASGYQDLSSRLVKALREAIETDMGDASEREVGWQCQPFGMLDSTALRAPSTCPGRRCTLPAQRSAVMRRLLCIAAIDCVAHAMALAVGSAWATFHEAAGDIAGPLASATHDASCPFRSPQAGLLPSPKGCTSCHTAGAAAGGRRQEPGAGVDRQLA
jgi:hypothetical protein